MRLVLLVPLLTFALLSAMPAAAIAPGPAPAPAPAVDAGCEQLAITGYVPTPEVGVGPCPGIRPGGAMILRVGPYWFAPFTQEYIVCSFGFLVTDGTDLYVTTAGHCVANADSTPNYGARVAAHGVPGTFGEVVWQWCEGAVANAPCSPGRDFGLIRIDPEMVQYADPAMCAWGAPSGLLELTTGSVPTGSLLGQHFGWGTGIAAPTVGLEDANGIPLGIQPANPATQARQGPVLSVAAATLTVATSVLPGDSGSGIMGIRGPLAGDLAAEPAAMGILTHTSGATGTAQRLDVSLAKASAELGVELRVVTAL